MLVTEETLGKKPGALSELEPSCFLPNEPNHAQPEIENGSVKAEHFPEGDQLPNPIEPNRTLKKYFDACLSLYFSIANRIEIKKQPKTA